MFGWVQCPILRGINMKLYRKAIKTDLAFIRFENIQHISWNHEPDNYVTVKLYSSGGTIVQKTTMKFFEEFMSSYCRWTGEEY
jgi:hypothetical protein|tara:strand:+ start:1101 stop:1349 length:249 start_codon:yes stop_codon:yes gene_type:complete